MQEEKRIRSLILFRNILFGVLDFSFGFMVACLDDTIPTWFKFVSGLIVFVIVEIAQRMFDDPIDRFIESVKSKWFSD